MSKDIATAAMTPQAFCESEDDKGGTCARGAAMKAIGRPAGNWYWSEFFQWSVEINCTCPVCGSSGGLSGIIAFHLNDTHRWSRERIADFVELHEGLTEETSEVHQESVEAVQ